MGGGHGEEELTWESVHRRKSESVNRVGKEEGNLGEAHIDVETRYEVDVVKYLNRGSSVGNYKDILKFLNDNKYFKDFIWQRHLHVNKGRFHTSLSIWHSRLFHLYVLIFLAS